MFFVKTFSIIILIVVLAYHSIGKPTSVDYKTDEELLNDATKVLENSLNKLDAGDGPHFKLIKMLGAVRGLGLFGNLYGVKADLANENGESKICAVEIWSPGEKPEVTVTFECEGEEKFTKTHQK
uniref:Cystatin domain-containing protein n=1 Tax=Glossina brevipalpis TaxID=37001 RepID=A0A1A9W5L3_9MUSC